MNSQARSVNTASNQDQGKRSSLGISMWGALIFFAALWCLDFPKPYIDDLFYCSGGLSLAQGGGLDYPLIAGQGLAHSFFVYPPTHSYLLAGWLKLFGISAGSMTAFPMAMYCLISVATIAILRHKHSSAWVEWCVPVAVAAAFLRTGGLRPDALAIAMLMMALMIFEIAPRKHRWLFLFFLLLFFVGSTAPRMAIFSVAIICFAIFSLWREPLNTRPKMEMVLLNTMTALGVSFLIFLLMIHFRLGEFLYTFRLHLTRVADLSSSTRMFIMDEVGVLSWPLLGLPLLLLLLFRRRPWDRPTWFVAWLGITFLMAGVLGMLGPGAIWFPIFASLLLLGSGFRTISGWRAIGMQGVVLLALLIGNGKSLVAVGGELTGKFHRGQGEQRDAALALQPSPQHRIFVDTEQARYLFGYRIPPGFLAFEYGAPFPKEYVFEDLRPSDIYLVGPQTLEKLNERTFLNHPSPSKWKPVGPKRWWLNQYPRWIYIIPAEDCGKLRAR
jgi:hypothetical protein